MQWNIFSKVAKVGVKTVKNKNNRKQQQQKQLLYMSLSLNGI